MPFQTHQGYSVLPKVEETEEETILDVQRDAHTRGSNGALPYLILPLLAILTGLTFTVGALSYHLILLHGNVASQTSTQYLTNQDFTAKTNVAPNRCSGLSVRREWRTLSAQEKEEYLDAVKCFTRTPGELGNGGTIYDDFAYVHSQFALVNHNSPPFLPWHRQFIQVFENVLQNACGYNGTLPYWDWSLDWENLGLAPIWNDRYGFGGTGSGDGVDLGKAKAYGRCVTTGPFANLQPMFQGSEKRQHCLSRGIRPLQAGAMKPEAIDEIMEEANYEQFLLTMERGLHDVIPDLVRGDFMLFTAPNDPVFYLHHAALDRLWWTWQQQDVSRRTTEYSGKKNASSSEQVSLQDKLLFAGLAKDLTVEEVMDTSIEPFCYRY